MLACHLYQKNSNSIIISVVVLLSWTALTSAINMDRLCGRRLADTLELVCADRGFYWEVGKRGSETNSDSGSDQSIGENGEKGEMSRSKRSVTSECCRQTCTLAVLESYCAPSLGNVNHRDLYDRIAYTPNPLFVNGDPFQGEFGRSRGNPTPAANEPRRPRPAQIERILKGRSYFFVTPERRDFHYPRNYQH